jgi:myo-inositol-1(or 4)-monophosphatase
MSDHAVSSRLAAGRAAVCGQIDRFHAGFGRASSHWKADGTRVTEDDLAISEAIFTALRREFPGDDFFSEELAQPGGATARTADWSWVLDPIDGTNNFALGLPVTAISLGLLRRGRPAAGWVYDLGRRSLFHGGPGLGVWDGERRLAPDFQRTGRERIVALHAPIDPVHLPAINAVLTHFKLRAYGSGALHLTYAALGLIDACLDFTVKVWDVAAAAALSAETGAQTHYFNGDPFPLERFDLRMRPLRYLAGAPGACREILDTLQAAGFDPLASGGGRQGAA